MTTERKNSKPRVDISENPLEAFPRTHIDWGKSKETIWAELEKKVDASGTCKSQGSDQTLDENCSSC